MIEKYLDADDCYLVKISEELVGVFVITSDTADKMEFKNISVIPAHQHSGLGKEILE